MSRNKLYGIIIISISLLVSSLVIMISVLAHYIDQIASPSFTYWDLYYIPTPVYFLLLIPLFIGAFLLIYESDEWKK
ncbi:hypothetical protein H8S33_15315 [Ornithinibacillus sp. BX22]|uniref:DUF3955 domain-containing protein n=2 Tax=Ornithinibacillus TaxID=484508 RepID=A0A923RJP0_9BACI|nr:MULTISPECIES: hypothetical protein [Ornithinibacillus]MBC5638164.1 hypothetical protein [Ornithinibacillus hominis]MBS3680764.1 hypothetical protein [Ornithinibacillus massiliensis]